MRSKSSVRAALTDSATTREPLVWREARVFVLLLVKISVDNTGTSMQVERRVLFH